MILHAICIIYSCIFTSCVPLSNKEATSTDDPIIAKEQGGFFDLDKSVPGGGILSDRSQRVQKKIDTGEEIYIRLRLVLQLFYYVDDRGPDGVFIKICEPISLNKILEDIEYAEYLYGGLNIKFTISSVSFLVKKYNVENDIGLTVEIIKGIISGSYEENSFFLSD